MAGFGGLLVVLLAPIVVWEAVSPRSAWEIFESWRFSNPQAVRPSRAGFAARRVSAALLIVWAFAVWIGS